MAFCKNCGNNIEEAKFCSGCGTKVEETENNSVSSNNIVEEKKKSIEEILDELNSFYKGKNLGIKEGILPKSLNMHKNQYLMLAKDEIPLILVNNKVTFFYPSGMVITNKAVHFKTIKQSFFSGLWPLKGEMGKIEFSKINSLEIGAHDSCYGTSYIGHELRINGRILGYLRMGTGVMYDDKMIAYLTDFFTALAEEGILKRPPNKFNW